jgi:DNA mismatch endonuclease (patch repair protein)
MVDILTPEKRSWNMSRIRNKNTRPEKAVRSALRRMGVRFSLHRKSLSGKPDIVLTRHKIAIFVHGCFWHRHKRCKFAYTPKSRKKFWLGKFQENITRDARIKNTLRKNGWKVITIWECWTEKPDLLTRKLETLLNSISRCR